MVGISAFPEPCIFSLAFPETTSSNGRRHLEEFARQIVGEKLLLLFVVSSELFLLILQLLDLLQQSVADELFLLFRHQLLQRPHATQACALSTHARNVNGIQSTRNAVDPSTANLGKVAVTRGRPKAPPAMQNVSRKPRMGGERIKNKAVS